MKEASHLLSLCWFFLQIFQNMFSVILRLLYTKIPVSRSGPTHVPLYKVCSCCKIFMAFQNLCIPSEQMMKANMALGEILNINKRTAQNVWNIVVVNCAKYWCMFGFDVYVEYNVHDRGVFSFSFSIVYTLVAI
jgi:hypothetical protein